jgi:hypothetical protein
VLAHVGGVPVEELLPALAGAGGWALLMGVARSWWTAQRGRRPQPGGIRR